MRAVSLIPVLSLSACFTAYTPNTYKSPFGSSEQATTSCDELCNDDCGDIKTAAAKDACMQACQQACTQDKESCPRPEPTPPPTCSQKTCTPAPKAALCDQCTSDDQCAGTGSLCLGADAATGAVGHCGQKCVVDCDCPDTYECRGVVDPKTGHFDTSKGRQCVPESKQCPECKADADCKDGNICEAGKCVAACTGDDQCSAGQRCFEDGRCALACCFDTDCGDGQRCGDGRCVKK